MERELKINLLILFVFISTYTFAQYNSTPDWWQCSDRESGQWEFSVAPDVCSLEYFQDSSFVEKKYDTVISFSDQSNINKYMTALSYLIEGLVESYFKDKFSEDEKTAFIDAMKTMAHQESYFSHYRWGSNKQVKMLRGAGDRGHGHGLLQLDDRWHFIPIKEGVAADLMKNFIYGMEYYYNYWKKAKSATCVDSKDNYFDIAKSAYSAYNGGPSKICRWKDPSNAWARNDRGFEEKLISKRWLEYYDFNIEPKKLMVECILSDAVDCQADTEEDELQEGQLYRHTDEAICVVHESKLKCLPGTRDRYCFSAVSNDSNLDQDLKLISEEDYEVLDRNIVCPNSILGAYRITSFVEVLKNINLRKTPGGILLTTVPKNTSLQVLDFYISENKKRYIRIKYKSYDGYLYIGDNEDFQSWAKQTSNIPELTPIPYLNGSYAIDNQVVSADQIFIEGVNNEITIISQDESYRVGLTYPEIELKSSPVGSVIKKLQLNKWYAPLRSCQMSSCRYTSYILGSVFSKDEITLLYESNQWFYVKQGSRYGWIEKGRFY